MKKFVVFLFVFLAVCLLQTQFAQAQSTEFTYQGSLQNGGSPATGNFDFEFLLFDAATGGAQFGATVSLNNIAVTNGVFAVQLNFGNQFPGANRFLEIRVRQSGGGGFTPLTPRQTITSAPSAMTANNSLQLGGFAATSYVLTNDLRLSDARNPLPNSASYIQNRTAQQASSNFNISGNGTVGGNLTVSGTLTANLPAGDSSYIQNGTTQQSTSNFNISGSGTANILNAVTQYNINGSRVFSITGTNNTFVGFETGISNTTGSVNSFFGKSAGMSNTTGFRNSFYGIAAGTNNTTGNDNSFFGGSSGVSNTLGSSNSFFGVFSGQSNISGDGNSFFGSNSGSGNITGANNSFFGRDTSADNSFNVSLFGRSAGGSDGLLNATAIGFRAFVTQDNSLVLGSISGVNLATSDTNVGIGTTAPARRLHILGAGAQEIMIESSDIGGNKWTLQSSAGSVGGRFEIVDRTIGSSRLTILTNGFVGIGTTTPNDRLDVNGTIGVTTLGAAGSTSLCRNASNQISSCSSSIRYKSNINPFSSGLSLIKQLRPVSFNWKADNTLDFGLVAEEVNKIEPLLTTVNEKGVVEGVKYDRVGVVLVNAVNEQQVQIEEQARQIDEQKQIIQKQQSEIDQLKALVCSQNQTAPICQPKN